jgi:hypothetical protein
MLPSLMTYPAEVRDGLHVYETPRLWITSDRFLHLEVFDCGLYTAVLKVRTSGCSDETYRVNSRQLYRIRSFFNDSQEAIAWCKQFVRDWMQCEEEYQEDAYRAAVQRGDFNC